MKTNFEQSKSSLEHLGPQFGPRCQMRSPWVGVYLVFRPHWVFKNKYTHTIFNLFSKASSQLIGVADIAHKAFSLCTVLQDC